MNNINTNKFKKVLDDDPDIIIKTYLQDEDASILILRSGDLGDEDYRVSLEKQSIDEDGEEDYQEISVQHGTLEGIDEIINMYLAYGGTEESLKEVLSSEDKADNEAAIAAVKKDAFALKEMSDELKANKEVVMAAVNNFGNILYYASDELKADKEVVMAAVNNDGMGLQHASDELKANKEVVMAAVKNKSDALDDASDSLKKDPEILALIDN